MPRRRLPPPLLLLVPVLLLVLVVVLLLGSSGHRASGGESVGAEASEATTQSGFDGAVLPPKPLAMGFTLTDQRGRRVSLSDYRGKVVVLSFLYSRCGAACVLIAQQIRGALDELPAPVPVLIVSADPAADSAASVARFLDSVSLLGRAEYLTGTTAELEPLWRAYRVTPAAHDPAGFRRFASLLLLDARGRERVLFEPEVLTPESLTHDIRRLQAE